MVNITQENDKIKIEIDQKFISILQDSIILWYDRYSAITENSNEEIEDFCNDLIEQLNPYRKYEWEY